jgi:hypothetical protein
MPLDSTTSQLLRKNDKNLTSLHLLSNGCNRGVKGDEVKAVTDALIKNTVLMSLDLHGNSINNARAKSIAKALTKNKTLKELKLWNAFVRDAEVKTIAKALSKNTTLKTLFLGSNIMTEAGVKAIAEGLAKNTTLTFLGLKSEGCGDKGAKVLADALTKNTTLTRMSLVLCDINDAGAKALVEGLAENKSLIFLNLEFNFISAALSKQISSLIVRNQQYLKLKKLQATAYEQLRIGRILLYKTVLLGQEDESNLNLPLEMREKIVTHIGKSVLITEEQQQLILNYAEGRIAPVADKLSFFKVTKCDRVRKQIKQDKLGAAPPSLAS